MERFASPSIFISMQGYFNTEVLSLFDIFQGAFGLEGESGYSGASGMRVTTDN